MHSCGRGSGSGFGLPRRRSGRGACLAEDVAVGAGAGLACALEAEGTLVEALHRVAAEQAGLRARHLLGLLPLVVRERRRIPVQSSGCQCLNTRRYGFGGLACCVGRGGPSSSRRGARNGVYEQRRAAQTSEGGV